MPIAAFGLLAATVLGLGALTAADIQGMDQFGNRPAPFGSHQFGPPQIPDQGQFQQFHQLGNWPPSGHHH